MNIESSGDRNHPDCRLVKLPTVVERHIVANGPSDGLDADLLSTLVRQLVREHAGGVVHFSHPSFPDSVIPGGFSDVGLDENGCELRDVQVKYNGNIHRVLPHDVYIPEPADLAEVQAKQLSFRG